MKPPSRNRDTDPKLHWHRWFAWHPVHFRTESRWLTVVERRWDRGEQTGEAKWQYRAARNQPPPTDKPPDPAPHAKPQPSERLKLRILADIASRKPRSP